MPGFGLGISAIQQGYILVDDPGGLPEGAIAFADFKNGTYHYGGNTFDDFLYENTDYGTWDGEVVPGTGFVPASGSQNISLGAELIAEALTGGAGLTIVANVVMDNGNDFFAFEAIDLPDWNQDLIAAMGVDDGVSMGNAQAVADASVFGDPAPAGLVRVGAAISPDQVVVCANGATAIVSPLTSEFIVNFVGIWLNSATIEDLTFYSGAKTGAELEALTAP